MRQPDYNPEYSRARTRNLHAENPHLSYTAIALQLGISKPTVWRHLHASVRPHKSTSVAGQSTLPGKLSRFWTDAEIAYLEASAEIIPKAEIAKKLNRTERAVQTKLFRLGLSARTVLDNYSARYLAENLGVHLRAVLRWIRRGLLKATKASYWQIRAIDFANFCRDNPEIICHFDQEIVDWLCKGGKK